MERFNQIETWVFDLDNTLYSPDCKLFDQIDVRMGLFISNLLGIDQVAARRVQKDFFFRYGTTLRGLMNEHDIAPADFLNFVHDIDHSVIPRDEHLDAAIGKLPGKKYICTNGSVAHAEATLAEIGIGAHFEDIFDIHAFDYEPKPARIAYDVMLKQAGFAPERAAMFEDIARNLEVPHELGMATVLVTSENNEDGALINRLNGDDAGADYVHHTTDNISGFLSRISL